METINMPDEARYILDTLKAHRYEAYLVGGCIRNSLIGLPVKDWDITSNAKPEVVRKLFPKTILTGAKFGTVTVVVNKQNFEVTTFRSDGLYFDSRRPNEVQFTSDLITDLSRRDFAMNAIAYCYDSGFIDPFNGIKQIEWRVIDTVGSASKRFQEDPLRMMRAVRFASQLGFLLSEEVASSIPVNAYRITAVSKERIRDELVKILLSDRAAEGIKMLYELDMLCLILPEIIDCINFNQHSDYHTKDIFGHTLEVLSKISSQRIEIRLAALLHDIGKPLTFSLDEQGKGHFYQHDIAGARMTETILHRLKFPKKTAEIVITLVREHMNRHTRLKRSSVVKIIARVGKDNLEMLYELMEADCYTHQNKQSNFDQLVKFTEQINDVLTEVRPEFLQPLAINGNDIMRLGISQGKLVGDTLKYIIEAADNGEIRNVREILLEAAQEYISRSFL